MLATIKTLVITFLLVIPFSLLAQKEINGTIEVKPVSSLVKLDGHQVFYNLPMNILVIKLKITKTELFRGPYADFAARDLNITSGVIMADGTEFSLDSVSLMRYSVADTSCQYAIQYSGWENLPSLQLNTDGSILGYNIEKVIPQNQSLPLMNLNAPKGSEFSFFDLGTRPFTTDEKDDLAENNDSTITKKSHSKQGSILRTPEENAANAANFIRKIRKRKLKLLVSMYQESNAVEGSAMKLMIDELEKLEKSYVELFTGKSISTTYETILLFTPSKGNDSEQATLGWFSKSQGFIVQKQELRRNDSKPIIIKIEPQVGFPKYIIQTVDNSSKNPSSIRYGLYYRMPALTEVSIECPEILNIKKQLLLAQKGTVVPIPSEYLLGRRFSIEFDGQTGAIKRIVAVEETKHATN